MGFSAATREPEYPSVDGDSAGVYLIYKNGNIWNSTDKGSTFTQINPSSSVDSTLTLSAALGGANVSATWQINNYFWAAASGGTVNMKIAYSTNGYTWFPAGNITNAGGGLNEVAPISRTPVITNNGTRALIKTLNTSTSTQGPWYIIDSTGTTPPTAATVYNSTIGGSSGTGNAYDTIGSDGGTNLITGMYNSNNGKISTNGGASWADVVVAAKFPFGAWSAYYPFWSSYNNKWYASTSEYQGSISGYSGYHSAYTQISAGYVWTFGPGNSVYYLRAGFTQPYSFNGGQWVSWGGSTGGIQSVTTQSSTGSTGTIVSTGNLTNPYYFFCWIGDRGVCIIASNDTGIPSQVLQTTNQGTTWSNWTTLPTEAGGLAGIQWRS